MYAFGAFGAFLFIVGPLAGFLTWVLLIRFLWNAGAPRKAEQISQHIQQRREPS